MKWLNIKIKRFLNATRCYFFRLLLFSDFGGHLSILNSFLVLLESMFYRLLNLYNKVSLVLGKALLPNSGLPGCPNRSEIFKIFIFGYKSEISVERNISFALFYIGPVKHWCSTADTV